jgi:hypothetical protein
MADINYYDDSDLADFIVGGTYIESFGPTGGGSGRQSRDSMQNNHARNVEVVTKNPIYGDVIVLKCLKYYGLLVNNAYQRPDTGEIDPGCLCSSVTVSQSAEKPTHWTGTAEYTPFTWGGVVPGGDPNNPLDWLPIPVWINETFESPLIRDFNGDRVANSAGDNYSPPQTTLASRKVLVIERNEADFSEALADVWRNKANEFTWNGYAPKMACCRSITGTPKTDPFLGVYYSVKYEFEFWDRVTGPDVATRWVLDAGWNEVVSGQKIKIFNDDLTEPSEIPLLDGSGGRLAPGGTPVFKEVQYRDVVDFDGLNILLA